MTQERKRDSAGRRGAGGFLARLRRDQRGNTLAIMGASLFPMLAMGGSAIDYTRMVVVKARLQQACDAGVLAGRKFLVAGNALDSTVNGINPATQAQNYFKNNYRTGFFSTTGLSFTPTKTSDSQVAGTARATVPMLIMGMFGATSKTLNVSCQARYDVSDIDIVFVLDVTGSMACVSSDSVSDCNSYAVASGNVTQDAGGRWMTKEKSGSRLAAMRQAVKDFYTELSANADASTHIRVGFVPYSVTVNFGSAMPRSYMVTNNATYQSRTISDTFGSSSNSTSNVNKATCDSYATNRSPATGYPASKITTSWSSGTCTKTTTAINPNYTYQPRSIDVSPFLNGANSYTATDPTAAPPASGAAGTVKWDGCVEERGGGVYPYYTGTTPSSTSPPLDLDPDTLTDNEDRRFRPYMPDLIYWRDQAAAETTTTDKTSGSFKYVYGGSTYYIALQSYHYASCPKQVRRLTAVTSMADITSYVDDTAVPLRAHGMTYHDIGMVWGLRLISPTGIFKTDTAAWPGRNPPNRYIVFLTDGDMENSGTAYTAHGWEFRDNRTAPAGTSDTDIEARHNARFRAACDIATDVKGIKVFVVAYAQTLTTDLTGCASPGKAFYAANDTALRQQFRDIAKQIAMLRLDQ